MLRRVAAALSRRFVPRPIGRLRALALVAGGLWLGVQVATWPVGLQPAAALADTVVADGSELLAGQSDDSGPAPPSLSTGNSAAGPAQFEQGSALTFTTGAAGSAARIAIAFARAQLGLPYQWGGDGPAHADAGFDCSGLTHAAYAAAGIGLPRTAHTQYNAGPHVAPWVPLQPGDLVFYGTTSHVHHVGLYIGNNQMINAPTFGQPVRIAFYRWVGDDYVGATRPAAEPGHLVSATDPHPPALPPAAPGPGPGPWPAPSPSPTPSPSTSPTPSPTPTTSPSPTPSPSCPSPSTTTSPSPTADPSASPSPSCSPGGSPSLSPDPTPSPTPSVSPTPAPTPSPPPASPTPSPAQASVAAVAPAAAAPDASPSPSPAGVSPGVVVVFGAWLLSPLARPRRSSRRPGSGAPHAPASRRR
ncbi:MAG: C40 family peptidase [Actinomycetota bacterium]|nr:C40 family peptidase [Actinomycetota bacterium]